MKTEQSFLNPDNPETAEAIAKRSETVAAAVALLGLAGPEVGEVQDDIS